MPANVVIRIGATTAGAVSEIDKVNSALGRQMTGAQKAQAAVTKAAVPAAAALAAIGLAAKKSVGDASDLNEQMNKSSVVFGKSGDDVIAWSGTLTKSFGLSKTAALEAAGEFGNMLVPMKFSRTEAANMSKQMVELAGDMASFNNASPEDTLAAIASGLAGQSEPLRKYGVFLDDARLKQQALNMGLYDGKGALDANAKAQATMAIVLADTGDAQGDFARTADSAANQTRIQAAEAQNLSAALGQSLLPAWTAIQAAMIEATKFAGEHQTAVKVLVGGIALLAAGILAANVALKAYKAIQIAVKVATAAWSAAQWLLNAALSANPIGLVIVAVAALAAGIVIAYRHSETFRNICTAAFNAVKVAVSALGSAFNVLLDGARAAFNWIVGHWKVALFAFGPIGAALGLLAMNFDKVKQAGAAAFNAIQAAIDGIAGAIQGVIGAVQSLIGWLGRIKVPHINLPGPLLAPAPAGLSPRSTGATSRANAGGAMTVNVYGAVDPEGTARAIGRILDAHARRQGRLR